VNDGDGEPATTRFGEWSFTSYARRLFRPLEYLCFVTLCGSVSYASGVRAMSTNKLREPAGFVRGRAAAAAWAIVVFEISNGQYLMQIVRLWVVLVYWIVN
jgi:hypothetical protein